jgi:hypothetical protein
METLRYVALGGRITGLHFGADFLRTLHLIARHDVSRITPGGILKSAQFSLPGENECRADGASSIPAGRRFQVDFKRLAGSDFRERHVYPTCIVCERIVHPYGVDSPSVISRYDHADGEIDCPL